MPHITPISPPCHPDGVTPRSGVLIKIMYITMIDDTKEGFYIQLVMTRAHGEGI